jgi:uncharacterized paraquat-inducible protein A
MNEHSAPTQIECLACGATRIVFGLGREDTGECPRCHYLGWGFSDDLDGSTRRLIMNGAFAVPPAERPRYGEISRPRRPRFR